MGIQDLLTGNNYSIILIIIGFTILFVYRKQLIKLVLKKDNIFEGFTVDDSPINKIYNYIPQPDMYNEILCDSLAKNSTNLDIQDPTMTCSEAIPEEEKAALQAFLLQEIRHSTNSSKIGGKRVFTLLDFEGNVNRGKKVDYYEAKAMLYDLQRNVATPVIAEIYKTEGKFITKRIKGLCNMKNDTFFKAVESTKDIPMNIETNKKEIIINLPEEIETKIKEIEIQQASKEEFTLQLENNYSKCSEGYTELSDNHFENPSAVVRRHNNKS